MESGNSLLEGLHMPLLTIVRIIPGTNKFYGLMLASTRMLDDSHSHAFLLLGIDLEMFRTFSLMLRPSLIVYLDRYW